MPVIANDGPKVEVFKFTMCDIDTNQVVQSRRWAIREFLQRFGGVPTGSGVMIPADKVDALGMSELHLDPGAGPGGFQTSVALAPRS